MKIKDQVCSLELSMRLKELGVKQDSLFCWCGEGDHIRVILNETYDNECNPNYKICSAFTVAEIGMLLPNNTEPLTYWTMKISTGIPEQLWTSDILFARKSLKIFYAESEANLRAEMLIYLLENKLMELPNDTRGSF